MKILAITQARVGSTRLPEKILKTINGKSILEIHLERILKSKLITKLKVATTKEPGVERIIAVADKLGVEVYQGSINNVLDRFYNAALPEIPELIVRLTSDCPLIDPKVIDRVIQYAIDTDLDYVSNTLKPTFPDGLDTEVFKFSALQKAKLNATLTSEHEHVTPYIWKNSTFKGGNMFKSEGVFNDKDFSNIRLTLDTAEDLFVIKTLIEHLGINNSWMDYVQFLEKNSQIGRINQHHSRNSGYNKSILNDKSEI